MTSTPEKARRVQIVRNTRKSFLVGASWSHDPAWNPRLTHIYLGPWLMTVTTRRDVVTRPGSTRSDAPA